MFCTPQLQEMLSQAAGRGAAWKAAFSQVRSLTLERLKLLRKWSPVHILGFLSSKRRRRRGRQTHDSEGKQRQSREKSRYWAKNQCIVFQWITLFFMYNHHHVPFDTTMNLSRHEQLLALLQSVFIGKEEIFLKYQLQRMSRTITSSRAIWTQPETSLLAKMLSTSKTTENWASVAIELYQQSSGEIFKSGAACRQAWGNYLSPQTNKAEWCLQEDHLLVGYALDYGKRWCLIAKKMGTGRSEHTVKNRFYALCKRFLPKNPSQSFEKSCRTILQSIKQMLNEAGQQPFMQSPVHQVQDKEADSEGDQLVPGVKQEVKVMENQEYPFYNNFRPTFSQHAWRMEARIRHQPDGTKQQESIAMMHFPPMWMLPSAPQGLANQQRDPTRDSEEKNDEL